MNFRILSILFVPAACLFSQQSDARGKKTIKQLKADIYYLASDSLEGRRTGSDGERKAGDYIENRYKSIGIAPYKQNYHHPFDFVYGKEVTPMTQLRIGNNIMRQMDDFFPLPFSANNRISDHVLPEVMEDGGLWLINLYSDVDESNSPHFDAEKAMFEKSKDAAKHGAKGIIFYDGFSSKYAPTFSRMSEYETLTIPVLFLTNTAYRKFVPQPETTDSLKPVPEAVIEFNIMLKKTERKGTNIAAYIDNKAPLTVVLGAHYDHLGHGEDGNSLHAAKDGQIHNGADDNASGTAALLVTAEWIKKHKLRHYNYLFINFSGEELGLLGSKHFVKDEKLDSLHIAYMINMDMVGRLNDSTHALTLGGIGTSPAWGKLLEKPNKNFKMVLDSAGVGPSDHTSFYLNGIPVLFFFTGTHKDYHKPGDDADKINYKGEAQVIEYVCDIVKQMESEPKPKFTATKQSSVGRVNFKVTLGIMPDYSFTDGGVRVDGVSDDRPAKKAGVKEGDIIIQLGDYKVQGMQSYMEALSKFKAGDKTTVIVKRSGQEMSLPLEFIK